MRLDCLLDLFNTTCHFSAAVGNSRLLVSSSCCASLVLG